MLLNCDMGESFGNYSISQDDKIMPHVDMANIACGMHASDPEVMNHTVTLAKTYGVRIGAHPGYPDLQGFGRRNMALSPSECKNTMLYQVGALSAFCRIHEVSLDYIKPHGALYNTMMRDEAILRAALQVAAKMECKLMILATARWQEHKKLATEYGTEIILEGFVDRGYEDDGSLINRNKEGALIAKAEMIQRVKNCCLGRAILSRAGNTLNFPIDSLCVHGDGDGAHLIKEFKTIIEEHA
ncbi:5-oxoprolinase subunit PxpA [Desulfotalea psychrophila]|uniref:LamB/YcsF family protein n=1 Tax=Desulfotalea psychrophila (strain LSv54 / DSM 12343) TaxID=177439 RepID=Q6ANH3_DESPS|nr:5-oxoprolinase subunit PxpA [Desulfotalea psychrophila]CAG36101.1 conserved hypothetical protein [Desulfotalea psychrophila LSv54]